MNGKGDKYRPVDKKQYDRNYENIFTSIEDATPEDPTEYLILCWGVSHFAGIIAANSWKSDKCHFAENGKAVRAMSITPFTTKLYVHNTFYELPVATVKGIADELYRKGFKEAKVLYQSYIERRRNNG